MSYSQTSCTPFQFTAKQSRMMICNSLQCLQATLARAVKIWFRTSGIIKYSEFSSLAITEMCSLSFYQSSMFSAKKLCQIWIRFFNTWHRAATDQSTQTLNVNKDTFSDYLYSKFVIQIVVILLSFTCDIMFYDVIVWYLVVSACFVMSWCLVLSCHDHVMS